MNPPEESKGVGAPGTGIASIKGAIDKVSRRMGGGGLPPSSPPSENEEDDEDDGMLRMSFLEHLEELRSRIFRALGGVGLAFLVSLSFSGRLWDVVRQPAKAALTSLGYEPDLVQIEPMEAFNIIWFKVPIICAIFLGSPIVLYQVWAFISPGLYRRERRWAAPFILISAGLFIAGGLFAYFVVFRYGLTFLLSIGQGYGVKTMISMSHYFELFFNVVVGVGLVFELPVLIFFLTLLRIVSPVFLLNHSRYAILGIFIIAAIVTPTPDVFNLMLFATPMCLLFFVGIFASYLLVLHRENRKFPWRTAIMIMVGVLLLVAGVLYLAITKYGYKPVPHWPFLTR
ncbi:MAG TPA: twin-arginine translocase subunit TatC [Bryobacteraceae bacterium]|nr:twin-arginine translocase subunit TatC [Bryobacteraceae bacterium]